MLEQKGMSDEGDVVAGTGNALERSFYISISMVPVTWPHLLKLFPSAPQVEGTDIRGQTSQRGTYKRRKYGLQRRAICRTRAETDTTQSEDHLLVQFLYFPTTLLVEFSVLVVLLLLISVFSFGLLFGVRTNHHTACRAFCSTGMS